MSSLKRQQTNHTPTTIIIGPYCAQIAGYSVREILTDAQKSAEAHLAFYDRFHPDSLIIYNDLLLEAETIGCELVFPEDNISHAKAPILTENSNLADLKVPDPKKDGRIPYLFEVIERVSTGLAGKANAGGVIPDPGILPATSGEWNSSS